MTGEDGFVGGWGDGGDDFGHHCAFYVRCCCLRVEIEGVGVILI